MGTLILLDVTNTMPGTSILLGVTNSLSWHVATDFLYVQLQSLAKPEQRGWIQFWRTMWVSVDTMSMFGPCVMELKTNVKSFDIPTSERILYVIAPESFAKHVRFEI